MTVDDDRVRGLGPSFQAERPPGAVELEPFFAKLFGNIETPEDATAAAMWIQQHPEEFTQALNEYLASEQGKSLKALL